MRSVWFAAGAASSLYLLTKARRAREALTPEGLEDRLAGLSVGLHLFGREVSTAMAEKEGELRERMRLQPAAVAPALTRAPAEDSKDDPAKRERDRT